VRKLLWVLFILILSSHVSSCSKEDFSWNLKKAPKIGDIKLVSNSLTSFSISSECLESGFDKNAELGFCWSTNPNPSIEDSLFGVQNASKVGFSSNIKWEGVSSYYIRAYVRNSLDTVYSNELFVSWPGQSSLPQVQTNTISNIYFYGFSVSGIIQNDFGVPIIEKGMYVSLNSMPNALDAQKFVSNSSSSEYSTGCVSLTDGMTYYVRAYVKTLAGIGLGNVLSVTLPKKYAVGQIGPAGGTIFYENPDPFSSWHYLEAAPFDLNSTYTWSFLTSQTNVTSLGLGMGDTNTQSIVSVQGNSQNYAAKVANDWTFSGYTDWCLPSFEELKEMKSYFFDNGMGAFTSEACYWSSSEDSNYPQNAWNIKMTNSNTNVFTTVQKLNLLKVRAIRKF
jgi:hypothetical protein